MKPNTVLFIFCLLIIGIFSCGSKPSEPQKSKLLVQPVSEKVEMKGALMIVDSSIMVLITNNSKFLHRTVLIPANDSIKDVANCSYENRIDKGCRISFQPWIEMTGNYIRKDSIQPIIKFSALKVLDDGTTCSIISEE